MLPENWKQLGYPGLNINDHTLDKNLPEYAKPLRRELARRNAGDLEILPLEIVHLILTQLDLRSAMNFRYVNRRCADLADSLPEWKSIALYGQNALRGSLAIKTAAIITVEKLFQQLFEKSCENCGDFAPYLYLITCARVCFPCLSYADQYFPIGRSLIKRKFGLDYKKIESLLWMKCVPGVYSPAEGKLTRASVFYDAWSVEQAAVIHHGSRDNLSNYISNAHAKAMDSYHERIRSDNEANRESTHVRKPATLFPHDRRSSDPRRFLAIIELPVVKKGSSPMDFGFYCGACRDSYTRPCDYRVRYDEETFEQHLLACGSIKNGIHRAPSNHGDTE